jgi:Ca2+-binding EF-hand superfamily protein
MPWHTTTGITPSSGKLRELLSSRPGGQTDLSGEGVNFMEFLTMMGEHLFDFDGEAELIEAFESFDEGDTGFVKGEEMRRWLSEVGERMEPEEVRASIQYIYISGSPAVDGFFLFPLSSSLYSYRPEFIWQFLIFVYVDAD